MAAAAAEPMDRCWRCFHQLLDLGPGGICAKPIDPMRIERPCACPLFVVGPPDKGVCRSCGAGIVWWRTRYGKAVPCDPDGVNHFATCPTAAQHRRRRPTSVPSSPASGGDRIDAHPVRFPAGTQK